MSDTKTVAFIVLVTGAVVVVLSALLYRWHRNYLFRRIINTNTLMLYASPVPVAGNRWIPASSLSAPRIPREMTYSFWLKVNNWYANYGQWKHIFHRASGASDRNEVSCRSSFDPLSMEDSYPSVFLAPETNDLLFFFRTQTTMSSAQVCRPASSSSTEATMKTKDGQHIESVMFENVPLEKWFHVALVLTSRTVELYVNGLLHKTVILKGTLLESIGPCWFGLGTTTDGYLKHFRFIPVSLTADEVKLLHDWER